MNSSHFSRFIVSDRGAISPGRFAFVGCCRVSTRCWTARPPRPVIGTGGYVSGPVVFRAAARGIPTGIIELDVRPGLATRWLASRASEIWLAVPEAITGLPVKTHGKVHVTGAPIVVPDLSLRQQALANFGFRGDRPDCRGDGREPGCARDQRVDGGMDRSRRRGSRRCHLGYGCHDPRHVCPPPPGWTGPRRSVHRSDG